jgi:hypothetical protein
MRFSLRAHSSKEHGAAGHGYKEQDLMARKSTTVIRKMNLVPVPNEHSGCLGYLG